MKKLLALALAAVTLLSLFVLGACKNPNDNNEGDGGDIIIPPPDPVDGLTLIAGNWKIDELQVMDPGEGTMPQPVPTENYALHIESDGSLTLNYFDGQTDHTYQGTAENAETLNYYRFTCTMDEITVRADAYLYPDGNTLSFSSIVCEGGFFTQNYSSCICVRSSM